MYFSILSCMALTPHCCYDFVDRCA